MNEDEELPYAAPGEPYFDWIDLAIGLVVILAVLAAFGAIAFAVHLQGEINHLQNQIYQQWCWDYSSQGQTVAQCSK